MHALRPYWLTTISIFSLMVVRVFFLNTNIINPDCAMFLRAGQLIIGGARPYVDFVELNPPLVFYVYSIAAYIAKLTGFSAETSLYIFTSVLFAFSLLLCWNLLKNDSSPRVEGFGPVIVAFGLGNLLCYEWVQFGQRQQLLANALLPFFVCRNLRWQGTAINPFVAALSGLYCGLMTALLPQYAAIVVCLELFYVWRQRQLRPLASPETFGFAASIGAYVLLVLSQETIRSEFLGRWLPMVSEGYALYNWPWPMQITQLIVSGILPVSIIALLLLLKNKTIKRGLLPAIFVFFIGAVIAILLQGKCILNQTIPLMYASLMLCCSVPINNLKKTLLAAALTLSAFLVPVYALPGVISQNQIWQTMTGQIIDVIEKESSVGDRVSVLSLSLPDSYPALTSAPRYSGNRYFFVFPMLMAEYLAKKHSGEPAAVKWQAESQKFIDDLTSDLQTNKPRLILIQENTIPTAKISVRKYLEQTSFWQSINQDYQYAYPLKAGISELSVWKRR